MLGDLILSAVCYEHFAIEHVKGHHKNVSTPNDPASAKLNQNFYQFYIQTMTGTIKSAYHIQKRDLKRLKNSKKFKKSAENIMRS